MAAGYLTLHRLTGDAEYRRKAIELPRLARARHKSPKFQEYSWANHFDFASRGGHYSKDESIIVWTALIGQAFLDGFEATGDPRFLEVAEERVPLDPGVAEGANRLRHLHQLSRVGQSSIHNANMLGAAFLARTWRHTRIPAYLRLASQAMDYSCSRQRPDGALVVHGGAEVPLDRQLPYWLQPRQPEMLHREHRRRTYRSAMSKGSSSTSGISSKRMAVRATTTIARSRSTVSARRSPSRPWRTSPIVTPSAWTLPRASPHGRSATCRMRTGTSITGPIR